VYKITDMCGREKYCLKHKDKKAAKFVRLKKYWFQEHIKDNT